jgi:hypothetical protein
MADDFRQLCIGFSPKGIDVCDPDLSNDAIAFWKLVANRENHFPEVTAIGQMLDGNGRASQRSLGTANL